jgi:exopolyphosphatase
MARISSSTECKAARDTLILKAEQPVRGVGRNLIKRKYLLRLTALFTSAIAFCFLLSPRCSLSSFVCSIVIGASLFFSSCTLAKTMAPIASYCNTNLTNLKHACATNQTLHLVMGNEAADTDSIISSIVLAQFLQQQYGNEENVYLPLINIPQEDMKLRQETLYLCQLYGIDTSSLIFLEQREVIDQLAERDKLRITLVDHNALNPLQRDWKNLVERIIDHHKDEEIAYPLLQERIIATTASAATLVSKYVSNIAPGTARLLLAPILLDSSNLQNRFKTTEADIAAVKLLKETAGSVPGTYFDVLIVKREDTTGFAPEMFLNKDFKRYQGKEFIYGISSLPSGTSWSDDFLPACPTFIAKQGLDFLMIFVVEKDSKHLIVYAESPELVERMEASLSLIKQLTIMSGDDNIIFYDVDISLSRKTLQPLFRF